MDQPEPPSGTRTGFDVLNPPADLGAARARLRSLAIGEVGAAPILHLAGGTGAEAVDGTPAVGAAGAVLADMVLWRTGRADLGRLAATLSAERPLFFLEPTSELGWRRVAHRAGRPLWRRAAGHDFERDLPVELRVVGLVVTDLVRFGTGLARVRSYAMGRAEPVATLGRPDGGASPR